MDLGLDGRVALVTGGSRGIGRATAIALAAEGARVAVAARTQEDVDAVAAEIGGSGFTFDSAKPGDADRLVDAVESELGPIEVYIANTGGPPAGPDPLGFDDEQWERANRTLMVTPMQILRRVVPGMRERGWGRVVSVSSSAVREPIQGLQLSNAYRPGVVVAFKELARENASAGITFNTVMPGRIGTDRIAANFGGLDKARAAAEQQVPAARLGEPEEVAAVIAFLASEQAAYVTGQWLLVDGGLTHAA